jgi:hypothetical protein
MDEADTMSKLQDPRPAMPGDRILEIGQCGLPLPQLDWANIIQRNDDLALIHEGGPHCGDGCPRPEQGEIGDIGGVFDGFAYGTEYERLKASSADGRQARDIRVVRYIVRLFMKLRIAMDPRSTIYRE